MAACSQRRGARLGLAQHQRAQARRHRLVEHRRQPLAQRVAVGRPLAHPRGILRVLAQPGLDPLALLGPAVQLAVDPGAEQFVVDQRARSMRHTTRRRRRRAPACGLAVEQTAQRGPRAAHARHHRAHRDVQHLGHLGIAELLDAHQQQRLALLGRQPRQRGQQVQAQADVDAGVAAQAVLRASATGWGRRSACGSLCAACPGARCARWTAATPPCRAAGRTGANGSARVPACSAPGRRFARPRTPASAHSAAAAARRRAAVDGRRWGPGSPDGSTSRSR